MDMVKKKIGWRQWMRHCNLGSSPMTSQNINIVFDVNYQANKLSWYSLKKLADANSGVLAVRPIQIKEQGGLQASNLQAKSTSWAGKANKKIFYDANSCVIGI